MSAPICVMKHSLGRFCTLIMLYTAGPLLSADVHIGGQWTEEVRTDPHANGGRSTEELRLAADIGIRNKSERKHRQYNGWPRGECCYVSRES